MGTRHITAVQLDGKYPIAQYGQWDGYPSGQGATVLAFLLHGMDRKLFEQKLRAARFGTYDEIHALWKEQGADDSGLVSMATADKFRAVHPQLSRDTGAKVLEIVQSEDDGIVLQDSITFAFDGLFCEWAYVIDLDNNRFEVYSGFRKETDGDGRFTGGEGYPEIPRGTDSESENPGGEYAPVQLLQSWPLDALPTEFEFLAELEPTEEEES